MEKRVKGFSLWFMPEGEEGKELKALILELSRKLDTPSFWPHVTLLGQVMDDKKDVLEKTARLASSLSTFVINLNGTDCLDEYFRCLFLIARNDVDLVNANLKARALFSRMDETPFMPHLSLVYGNLSVEAKENVLAELSGRREYSFSVRKISLFSTSGSPHEWYHVEDFPIG